MHATCKLVQHPLRNKAAPYSPPGGASSLKQTVVQTAARLPVSCNAARDPWRQIRSRLLFVTSVSGSRLLLAVLQHDAAMMMGLLLLRLFAKQTSRDFGAETTSRTLDEVTDHEKETRVLSGDFERTRFEYLYQFTLPCSGTEGIEF